MLQWFVATDPSATTGKSYATGSRGEVAVLLILRDPLEYLSRSSRVEEQTRGMGRVLFCVMTTWQIFPPAPLV